MTPEEWNQAKALFEAAQAQEPSQRAAFLVQNCPDDSLRNEVEKLLVNFQEAGSFLSSPVLLPRIPITGQISEVRAEDESTSVRPGSGQPLSTITGERIDDPMIGRHFGDYQLKRRVGQGGMAAVFLAVRADGEYRQQVAIKLVLPGLEKDEILNRFRKERQTLAGLDHPNIVKLLDGGSTPEGLPYLVMDYVEGSHIDEYCDNRKLSVEQRLRLFGKVSEAVAYAHQKRVIHRDLKPGNILVTAEGVPKLLDFGIAKVLEPTVELQALTQTGARCMTPAYASPEQVRGKPVTAATDIYSLGAVLYELLTGHRPYRLKEHTPAEIERAICEQEPENPSTAVNRVESETFPDGTTVTRAPEVVSQTREGQPDRLRRRLRGDLDNIVLKALQKEPERRYSSVEELGRDIDRHLRRLPVQARRSTLIYRASRLLARHKVAASAAVALVLLMAAAARLAVREFGIRDRTPESASTPDLRDVFALERSVAGDKAHQVKARLTGRDQAAGSRPVNLQAFDAYLQGNSYLTKALKNGGRHDENLREAANDFQRAIDADATLAPAYIGLAEALRNFWWPSGEEITTLKTLATKAVELAPASPDAYDELGDAKFEAHDWGGAAEEYQRALALNPNSANAHHSLGDLGDALGKTDQAWTEYETAQQLDPNGDHLSDALRRRAHYDRAIALLKSLSESRPEDTGIHWNLSEVYLRNGIYPNWVEEVGKFMAPFGFPEIRIHLRQALDTAGYRGALQQWAVEFERFAATKQGYFPGILAETYAALGDKDRAFYWLRQGCKERGADPLMPWVKVEPGFVPLHTDVRFKEILRCLGLPL